MTKHIIYSANQTRPTWSQFALILLKLHKLG